MAKQKISARRLKAIREAKQALNSIDFEEFERKFMESHLAQVEIYDRIRFASLRSAHRHFIRRF